MEALNAAFEAKSLDNREGGGAHGLGVLSRMMSAVETDPEVHFSQKTRPQMRQWWRRLVHVNVALHRWHCG